MYRKPPARHVLVSPRPQALSSQAGRLSPDGLASACTALLQLSVRLAPEQAVRFRPAVARSMPVLTARQVGVG